MCRTLIVAIAMGVAAPVFAQDPAAVGRGEQVYIAQKCSICHMVAGKGNKNGPLDSVGSRLSADDIRQWVTNAPVMAAKVKAERKPAMKVFANIAAGDLDDLVAYLQSLKKA
jgi:mono/diheme cytochrome c family protein